MKKAPDFALPDQSDTVRSLNDYAGKWLVVYFYPKDDTPGCTTEACSFRDEYAYLQEQGYKRQETRHKPGPSVELFQFNFEY